MTIETRNILVTGGAGYVGSVLVPKLLEAGHKVTVLDLYLYGEDVFSDLASNSSLREIKGDIRDMRAVSAGLENCDTVIHLACISNDPSFELDPDLGRSINYDAFQPLVRAAKARGVKRFIYASSSSVYGIKDEDNVTEDLQLEPLTDYSKYKALCEKELSEERAPGFVTCVIRPSTVCGYGPRLRLDLTVNILTAHAWTNRKIKVFGGAQKRPNIHIADMTDLYCRCMEWPDELIDGKIWNAGYENYTVTELAETVASTLGGNIDIVTTPSDDLRSYHVSSERLRRETGFVAKYSIADAVRELTAAFDAGLVADPMGNDAYYNIKTMQAAGLH